MALHDTDRTSPLRSNPSPTSADNIDAGSRMAHQTASTTYGAPGVQTTSRIQQQNKRILAIDSNNVPVADFGVQVDGSIGLRVAAPGIDVTTNTDPSQLIFNSSQDTFKIVDKLSLPFSVTGPAGSGSSQVFSVNHNLGYSPLIFANAQVTNSAFSYAGGLVPLPFFLPSGITVANSGNSLSVALAEGVFISNVNAITISIGVITAGFNATTANVLSGTAYFYILQESATTI